MQLTNIATMFIKGGNLHFNYCSHILSFIHLSVNLFN